MKTSKPQRGVSGVANTQKPILNNSLDNKPPCNTCNPLTARGVSSQLIDLIQETPATPETP